MPELVEAPELIKVSEAAKLAGVSYPHIWRLIQRGEVEAVRVGNEHGPLRVDRQAFLEWLHGDPEEAA
jgi:excisionase family DNA binding protein